jgi:hypothetical protein
MTTATNTYSRIAPPVLSGRVTLSLKVPQTGGSFRTTAGAAIVLDR